MLTYNHLHPNGSPIPSSEETLMLFATHLTQPHKPQSIKLSLFVVCMLHLEHSLPGPTAKAINLWHLVRGIKWVHGITLDSHLPITSSLLRKFRTFLILAYPDHLTLWAALLLAFFTFLRSSEFLALRRGDLHRTETGTRYT